MPQITVHKDITVALSSPRGRGMGWMPELPDVRDYTTTSAKVKPMLAKIKAVEPIAKLPEKADLREWCSPIENQDYLSSCTAHAGVGLYEYFERRAFGKHIDASRLFLYKTSRNLLNWTGDRGSWNRATMEALALFGVPPEQYWPYDVNAFEEEPTAFCYAFAASFKALKYYRLDTPGIAATELLQQVKTHLTKGLVMTFGFTTYNSVDSALEGRVPFPLASERVKGGHAINAVGYDDNIKVTNPLGTKSAKPTKGAILIRNSWGENWGEGGYGWLPYEFVLKGLTKDWWTMIQGSWIDTGHFEG